MYIYIHGCVTYPGLKCAPKSNHERVFCKREDVPLVKHLFHLFLHDHPVFTDLLHRKPLPCGLVSHQVHSTMEEKEKRGGRDKLEDEK